MSPATSNDQKSVNLNVSVYLQVSALRLEPVLDELLRVVTEAEHEVSLGFQRVDGFNSVVDLAMENVRVWLVHYNSTLHFFRCIFVSSLHNHLHL